MDTRLTDKHPRQRGAVTAIMAVLLLVVVALAQQVAMRSAGTGAASASLQSDGAEAMLLAESGLERAMYLFENGTSCVELASDGTKTLGNGSFTISASYATEFDGQTELDTGKCRVKVVGRSGSGNVARTLEAVFQTTVRQAWIVGDNGTIGLWDGAAVTSPSTGWSTDQLNDVYCVSASDCWAVGENGDMIRWNGTEWSNVASGTGYDLNGVTCTASNNCWAVGDAPYSGEATILRWNGTTWSSVASNTNDDLYEVSCASSSLCFAVGEDRTIQKWNGSSWSDNYGGGFSYDFYGVYCIPASTICMAVGNDDDGDGYIRQTDDGNFGYGDNTDSASDALYDVTCYPTTTSTCWAVGRNGEVQYSINSGASWSGSYSSGTSDDLRAVHCPADNTCFAAGEDYTARKSSGTSWSSSHSSSYSDDFYGIHCVSTTDCWAVGAKGYSGYIERWNGSSWDDTTYNVAAASADLNDVTCVTSNDCWSVGDGGKAVHFDGGQWSDSASGTSRDLYGVSCVIAGGCFAVGDDRVIRKLSGGAWVDGAPSLSESSSYRWHGVYCLDAEKCFAVGYRRNDGQNYGYIMRTSDGGSTWVQRLNGGPAINDVTCLSESNCWASAEQGMRHWTGDSWDTGSWGSGGSVGTPYALKDVHCVEASDCWVVGANGVIRRWTGSGWSAVSSGVSNQLNAVHCAISRVSPLTYDCLAVGNGGKILVYDDPDGDGTSAWREWGTYTNNNLNGVFVFPKYPPRVLEWRETNL